MTHSCVRRPTLIAIASILFAFPLFAEEPTVGLEFPAGPIDLNVDMLEGDDENDLLDEPESVIASAAGSAEAEVEQVLFQLDQTIPLQPGPQALESQVRMSPAAQEFASTVLASRDTRTSMLARQRRLHVRSSSDVVFGSEGKFRVATDTGSLLQRSPSVTGVQSKNRSPIITETRVHGSTQGQLLASGSYWFPARQDLDTALSKIDSRIVDDVIVIKGPFSVHYGPGFDFIDFQLLRAPRFENGYHSYGSTSVEYKTNGEQLYGRQSFWGGNENYGWRISYGNRTGNDYQDADGNDYLSSYQSQDIDVALGYDVTDKRHLELSYIWQEQNDVEIPTQLLDINHLRTHGFEAEYLIEDPSFFDVFTMETWYNTTSLTGDSNSSAKRQAIPFLGANVRSIVSDAENMSTGFSFYGDLEGESSITTLGADLRYLTQEVNHFSDIIGLTFPNLFGNNATAEINGPVPPAYSANPGLFLENTRYVSDRLTINSGARVDIVEMNGDTIVNEVNGFSGPLGLTGPNGEFPFVYNPSADPVVIPGPGGGTFPGVPAQIDDLLLGSFNRSFGLGATFIEADYQINPCWSASCGFGYGMRAPTMTELYSMQHLSTIFPQQTFSILFGNPNLKPERRYQINAGLATDQDWFRCRINGFSAWIENYITFDAIAPDFYGYQTVNTDLATLVGFDLYGEMDISQRLSSFMSASYTEGRDRTRTSNPLLSLADPPPGTRSGVVGVDSEPLPNISPMEARLGFRVDNGCTNSPWVLEISARFVDNQDLIARSLGELPTPGFTTLDLRGFWRATDALTINAGVENFGDRQYQEHLDPHGRELRIFPTAPVPAQSLGSVFQPGVNFYLATELTY